LSTYTESHKQYYLKNREKILAERLERERKWLSTPEGKYSVQKRKAKQRKIEWKLSFADWHDIWLASGKWEERGWGADSYCMCRNEDKGAYEVGNVRIDTHHENSLETYTICGVDEKGRYASKAA
jgi:hypothetical protein